MWRTWWSGGGVGGLVGCCAFVVVGLGDDVDTCRASELGIVYNIIVCTVQLRLSVGCLQTTDIFSRILGPTGLFTAATTV